jgi:hypothetical protein
MLRVDVTVVGSDDPAAAWIVADGVTLSDNSMLSESMASFLPSIWIEPWSGITSSSSRVGPDIRGAIAADHTAATSIGAPGESLGFNRIPTRACALPADAVSYKPTFPGDRLAGWLVAGLCQMPVAMASSRWVMRA